jgi:hypothetical protein
MGVKKPYFLSRRAHRTRLSEILILRAQLRTIKSQVQLLAAAKRQLTVNIRYYEGQVRPRIASSLREQGA